MGKSIRCFNYLSVLLVISVLWKPAYSNDKCAIECKGTPKIPCFVHGQKYNYAIEGTVSVFLSGADKQETSVKLIGQVSVAAFSHCDHELTVQQLTISGPDGKKYPAPPGIEKPVRFSLQDGRLGADLCAVESDTRRSLNIKRALISLLQSEQKSSTQVDVFGVCATDASSSQEGDALLVHRSRDLSRCALREQASRDLVAAIYNPAAEIKESQVLQSTLNVESKLKNGIPEKVSATEEYLYKPFSVGENGARAKVHTKITLTGTGGAGNGQNHCSERRSIIFEAPHGVPREDNAHAALAAIKDTAKVLVNEASSKSAGQFAQLVRILRATNKDDLMKVFNQVKGNTLEKRVFIDAVLRAGTGASIEASINILKSHSLSSLEEQLVYLSLGNAKHVNNEAVKAAAGLLDNPELPKEVYLGVGALAGAYCREHDCRRTRSDGVVALSRKLADRLHNCKPTAKPEEDVVVAVLKGIRNIRYLEDKLGERVAQCAAERTARARVRAAALEAFHAEPCRPKIKKTAIELLKNRQLDSEIRIQAYLAVIACPCGHSANEIKTLLETEPVNQVGHYITTSLRHLRTSSNPDKQLAKQHYGLIRSPKKFSVDDRKYSFYRELSYNVDALGAGGAVEQSVIYSQDSFLPRSASLNLTTELFGHSYNVLELGGRQGNLDLVVEHFLGPKGLFRSAEPQQLYDSILKRFQESKHKVEEGIHRKRRSIKSDIDNFDKNLKAESTPYNNELDLDIYVKLFGTDAVFLSLGDGHGFDFNKALDQLLNACNGGISQLKHFSQELRTHLLFIDAELVYPTSTGLPLKLDLVGSATARFDVSTNIDIRQIIKSPQNAKIDIKLVPSSDIEISGMFLIDADAVTTGLKVVTNLHSSTGGHLIAKVLENGQGFDLQFALPIDKQEILTASNDLIYVTAEKGQKEKETVIKVDTDRKEYSGCFDQLSSILGLTLCGEVSVPFSVSGPDAQSSISKFIARYPLTGSSKVKIVLEKNDLKGYHIKGLVREDKSAGKRSFELLFDAEGSKNRRTQLSGEYVYNDHEAGASVAWVSPVNTLSASVFGYQRPNELAAEIKAKLPDGDYNAKLGFTIQGDQHRSVYKPILTYSIPSQPNNDIKIEGQLTRECNGPVTKYTIDGLNFRIPQSKEPLEVNGFVSTTANTRAVDFNIEAKDLASLKGEVKANSALIEFKNKLNPFVNFRLSGNFDYNDVIKNEIEVCYGGDLNDQNNRVVIGQYLKYHVKSEKDFNVISKNKFEILALPFKINADADVDPKKVDIDVGGVYLDKKASLSVDARTQIKKPGDYSVKVAATADKFGIEVFAKRDIVSADKSNLENYVNIKNIGRYELSGVVLHKVKPNDLNIGANGHLKITAAGKTEDIKFDVGAIENANLYSTHAKISANQGEILDALLKVTRGANPSGQLKFILKDSISANGQFKVTDNDGKGNGVIIVDFKKSQRKLKGDVKFVAKEPVFNADVELFLNFEKDNNDKIHISTNTKANEKQFDSKNSFEYKGQKTEVNVQRSGTLTGGRARALLELVLPTARCLALRFDRDVTVQDGVYNGHAQVTLSDAAKRGGAESVISYKGKTTNSNFEKQDINYEGQLELKLKDGKQLVNAFSLKNAPQGDKKFKFEFKTDVTGNLLPKPAALEASATYLESELIVDSDYHLKGNYGDDIGFDLGGIFEVRLLGEGEKKYVDDYTVTVRLPFEKAHDIKWVSTVIYHQAAGQDVAEYTIVELVQVNAEVYKVEANGKLAPTGGSGTAKLGVPRVDPLVLDAAYKIDKQGDSLQANWELKAKYGKGKSAVFNVVSSSQPHEKTLTIKANAPQEEKFKKLEFSVNSKNPSPGTYSSVVEVDADGRVYKTEYTAVLSKAHPVLDFKYTSPSNPKSSRIYVKGSSLSSTQGKVEIKVDNVQDICLDVVSEANVQKDNVNFKLQANSEKLGWKNAVVEINSKDAGNGKRLEFQSVNDNKNILSGSTSYISKQEGQKTIIEGSGSVKIKEEQKSATFKFIRTLLVEGNEKGVETFFNVVFGERSYVAETRITNLEYKNSHVYCEEKKQCAHAEIQSKIDISKQGVIQNVINAGFDLRKLGVAPEFGLLIKDEISNSRLPQYSLDLHVNKEDKKYHLHVYNTPEYGNAKSGITVQIPTRVLALESVVSYPTEKLLPFPIKGEVSFDLDKSKQGHKTQGRFLVDLNEQDGKNYAAVAEFGFSHPRIDREAVVSVRGSVFNADGRYKIETTGSIAHACLGGDREVKLLLEADTSRFKFMIITPLVKVVDVEAHATLHDDKQSAGATLCLLEAKPVHISAKADNFKYFEVTATESNRKIVIISHLDPDKKIDISANLVVGGQNKNLFHGGLNFENNDIKTDYGTDAKHWEKLWAIANEDLTAASTRIKNLGEKANEDLKATLERVQPTLNKLQQAYKEDIDKFYKEVADDKAISEGLKVIHDIIVYVSKILDSVHQSTKPIVDQIVEIYTTTTKKIQEVYEKQLEKQIKEVYATIGAILKEFLDGIIQVVSHYIAIGLDFFEKHKPELQELTNTLTAIVKDLTRLLVAQLKEFHAKVRQITSDLSKQIQDLPIVGFFKEKWEKLTIPVEVQAFVQNIFESLTPLLPTPETKQFAETLKDYITKKLKQEKCNDVAELRAVYKQLVSALVSLAQLVRTQLAQYGVPATPLSVDSWFMPSAGGVSAPALGGEASLSALQQLARGDVPDALELARAYRPRSLNPLDEVPAKLRAVIVNGQHIFTFDGRHLTFPGSCRYILAHDHVDRNFTLGIQLQAGAPKAIILEDKSGQIVEIKDNGQVTLNGAAHGFPVLDKDIFAFRQPSGRVGVGSKYGVMVICTSKLEVCYVEVNGFYLGKLRGLLGDGNNEPYDDFRLPNGKVCTSESEFGNAYRLSRSCPVVQTPEHSHHQLHGAPLPAACEQVFGGSSPLKPLSFFLDVSPFRQACIHACTDPATALSEACDLARGYTALALSGLLPAMLPDACLRCTDADRPREVNDVFDVKLPGKQADIVVAVETTVSNEKTFKELVVPLIGQLVDQLKSRRITDIKVYLVGITNKFPYPILYDNDLKLKNAKIVFDDKTRKWSVPQIKTSCETLDKYENLITELYSGLRETLGLTNIQAGYDSLIEMPLRAGAVKHAISVVGESCHQRVFLWEAFRAGLYSALLENNGYSLTIVAPTPDIEIGAGKKAENIVAYSEKSVLLLGDKKFGKDTENLRATLKVKPDGCTSFVEDTDGWVISSSNFFALNAAQQKGFLSTAAGGAAARVTRSTSSLACACARAGPFAARSVCTLKDKKETRRRK